MSEPIGELLDSLGVIHTPSPGEMYAGALVLLKVVGEDGSVRLRSCHSDGMSWLERVGMLRTAETSELSELGTDDNA